MIPYSVTFGGISGKYASWKEATFAVLPFPIDMTTTYMAGTRNGPRAILDASSHMELFDEENKIEPYRQPCMKNSISFWKRKAIMSAKGWEKTKSVCGS